MPRHINTSPLPNPSMWQHYAKFSCIILFTNLENIGQKSSRKLFQLVPTMEQGLSTGHAGRSGTAEWYIVAGSGTDFQKPPQGMRTRCSPSWRHKVRHTQTCWSFGKGQGRKPFSFPLSEEDANGQSRGCVTSALSQPFKLLVRDKGTKGQREKEWIKHAHTSASIRHVLIRFPYSVQDHIIILAAIVPPVYCG